MKKILCIAMALCIMLSLCVMGVSAASDEVVIDISKLDRDMSAPDGSWEYIHEETRSGSSSFASTTGTYPVHRLIVYKDVVLTGESLSLNIAPMDDVTITLRNAVFSTNESSCACGDTDVICNDLEEGAIEKVTLKLEGENAINTHSYFAYLECPLHITGDGQLSVIGNGSNGDFIGMGTSAIVMEGGTLDVQKADFEIYDGLQVHGGTLRTEGNLWVEAQNAPEEAVITAGTIEVGGCLSFESLIWTRAILAGGKVTADEIYCGYYNYMNQPTEEEEPNDYAELIIDGAEVEANVIDSDNTIVNSGKVTAGSVVGETYVQNGGITRYEGIVSQGQVELPAISIEKLFKVKGGCLMAKSQPFEDFFEEIDSVSIAFDPQTEFTIDELFVVEEPAEYIEGGEPVFIRMDYNSLAVDEEGHQGMYVFDKDVHICTRYDITIEEVEGGRLSAPEKAYVCDPVEVTVAIQEGYEFKALYLNGQKLEGNTFEMPAEDVVITAEFEKIPEEPVEEPEEPVEEPEEPVEEPEEEEPKEEPKEEEKEEPEKDNPPTGDMSVIFAIALVMAAAVAFVGVRKIKNLR